METVTLGGMVFSKFTGHTDVEHYHQVDFKCAICKLEQSGILLCSKDVTELEHRADMQYCQQCGNKRMHLIYLHSNVTFVPIV